MSEAWTHPAFVAARTVAVRERGRRMLCARPHEQPFENAPTISGRLSSLTINRVTADVMFDGVSVRDTEMNGDVAYFIYRHAWRKGEEGRFMLSDDAVGAFQRTRSATRSSRKTNGGAFLRSPSFPIETRSGS